MASFNIFAASNTPQTLADAESGFIGQLGALSTTGVAIAASGSVDVTVLGALHSSQDNAIDHAGSEIELYVGQLGAIASAARDTVTVGFTDAAFVSNDGSLMSASDALDIRASDEGGRIVILNTGTISGVSDGIVTDSILEATRIVNHGSILGGQAGGIDHLGGDMRLVNYGEIAGPNYGYDGDEDVDSIDNFGSILGGVFGFAGDDAVRNAGFIDFVDLGDGDDVYDGRGGVVGEDVQGGAGDDVLRGGDAENLLRGGGGADILRGRGGDDRLRGDAGADIFRFAAGDGYDTILDFKGADTIDIEALGLRSFKADVRDAIEDARGGAVIDLFDDYGLRIFAQGVDASDIRAGDFLI